MFGRPLLLQAPCYGNVLWAWNVRHLELVAAIVGAPLRERERGASNVFNGSLLTKLPRWMKAAKNREAVLACIEKLRREPPAVRRASSPNVALHGRLSQGTTRRRTR